jgi:hypothetical protein
MLLVKRLFGLFQMLVTKKVLIGRLVNCVLGGVRMYCSNFRCFCVLSF